VTALQGITFHPSSTVLLIISFGKSTHKIQMTPEQVAKQEFSTEVFYYNAHYDHADSDFSCVYADVYERHPFTGTTLKCTATVKDVHDLLDPVTATARVAVALGNLEPRELGPGERDTAVPGFMTLEIHVPHEVGDSEGLPGTQLRHFDFFCPQVNMSLVDAAPFDIANLISKKNKVDFAGACAKLTFATIQCSQLHLMSALSTSHELASMVMRSFMVNCTYATPAEIEDLMVLYPRAGFRPGGPVSVNVLRIPLRAAGAAVDATGSASHSTGSGETSLQLSALSHSKLHPLDIHDEDSPMVKVVEDVKLKLSDVGLRLDGAFALRLLRFVQQLGLLLEHREPIEKRSWKYVADANLGVKVNNIDIAPVNWWLSMQTTEPSTASSSSNNNNNNNNAAGLSAGAGGLSASTASASSGFKSLGQRLSGTIKSFGRSAPPTAETKTPFSAATELSPAELQKAEEFAAARRALFKREVYAMNRLTFTNHHLPAADRIHRHVLSELVHELLRRLLAQAPEAQAKAEKLPDWSTFAFALPHLQKEILLLSHAPVSNSVDE